MSKKEFLEQYCKDAGITMELFYRMGFEAFPCKCGVEICKGWYVMLHNPFNTLSVN